MPEPEPVPPSEIERLYLGKLLGRLIPFLAILYVFCLLDRGNLSIASLTMQKDLHFSDTVYGVGAGVFFLGYFLFEVPSNLIMERVGARLWIARITAAMVFVTSPAVFYTLRFLLGAAEAGLFSDVIPYLTHWQPARRRGGIVALFMPGVPIAGVIGGPLSGWFMMSLAGA